jgi:HEAT repeat protein
MASDEGIDARLRESLVAALGRTRNAAVVPDLLRLAKESEAPEVRHAALGALGMVGSPEGVQELLNVVQGGSAEDRAVAATALQGVKNKSAGPLLEQALQGSLPPELKGHVVAALGSAGGKSSLELLGKMARDGGEAPGLRGAAVRAIGEIGDSAGAAAVLDVLEGTPRTEASLRRQCATALQSVATSADLPRIDKILRGVPENTSEWYVLRGLSEALRTGRPEGVIRR